MPRYAAVDIKVKEFLFSDFIIFISENANSAKYVEPKYAIILSAIFVPIGIYLWCTFK